MDQRIRNCFAIKYAECRSYVTMRVRDTDEIDDAIGTAYRLGDTWTVQDGKTPWETTKQLLSAGILHVHRDRQRWPAQIEDAALESVAAPERTTPRELPKHPRATARQHSVAIGLSRGWSIRETAADVGISTRTVCREMNELGRIYATRYASYGKDG